MCIPKLRFKEFHENWIESRLSELALKITDGTHDTPIVQKEGMPFLTAINIKDGFINYHDINYVDETTHKKIFERCNPEKDDLLIVNIGAGTATCARNIVDYPFSLKNVALVKPNKKLLNPVFLEQFQRKNSAKLFVSLTSGGAQPFLSLKEIGKLVVKYSSLEEQTKIASFLSAVDEKISQLNQKHELLSQYKQGMMQKLFSQQIRFKADDGSEFGKWEEKKIGEISTTFSGGTPKSSDKSFYQGNIPFIKSGEISQKVTEQYINEVALKNSSAKLINKGDLLYALYGATSGQVAISQINGAINQAILCIRSDLNTRYLLNFFLLEKEKILSTYLQGGQGNLSAAIIKEISIPVPSLEEQTKIANFLATIDQKIEVVAKQIEKAKQWKKGLLQQMFV